MSFGNRQSPIKITRAVEGSLPPLSISFRDGPDRQNLVAKNTGHTLHVDCVGQIEGSLTGGPVGEEQYTLQQFHFHWGDAACQGSEHALEGKTSSAELHFVFKNNKYGSVSEAIGQGDGLAVAGVLLNEAPDPEAKVLSELFEVVPKITGKLETSKLGSGLDLESGLPANRTYFTYLGSLTTPEYNECVTWILFKEGLELSSEVMANLRKMKDSEGQDIGNNWRDVQRLAGREVKIIQS